ncbi:hypothetical protein B0H19DRAFT_1078463 [Mycena capillaripes]|nr:hypothetical protein B0H19DRAFT_1078463 [Mycena capillaripes]
MSDFGFMSRGISGIPSLGSTSSSYSRVNLILSADASVETISRVTDPTASRMNSHAGNRAWLCAVAGAELCASTDLNFPHLSSNTGILVATAGSRATTLKASEGRKHDLSDARIDPLMDLPRSAPASVDIRLIKGLGHATDWPRKYFLECEFFFSEIIESATTPGIQEEFWAAMNKYHQGNSKNKARSLRRHRTRPYKLDGYREGQLKWCQWWTGIFGLNEQSFSKHLCN